MRKGKLIAVVVALLLAVAPVLGWRLWLQPVDVRELGFAEARSLGVAVPGFTEVPVDFAHVYAQKQTLPFAGGAVIDIDGDGREEVFVAGGAGQDDALLTFRDGRFVDVIGLTGLSSTLATYGALALDVDKDGDVDLIICREDGVYLYRNGGRGRFVGVKLPVALEPHAVPIAVAAGDVDGDGRVDLYISTFIDARAFRARVFNDPAHATANVFLRGTRDGGFTDATKTAGLTLRQNSLGAVFADLDNDGRVDLAVAQNTGQVLIYRNNGDGTFNLVARPTGFGFWMGLAVGDYDGDGDIDLFLSNVGNTVPRMLLNGDLRPEQRLDPAWALLRNQGGMNFIRAESTAGLDGYEFARGAVFADVNLDGRPDLVVAENSFAWPAHIWDPAPGRLLLQDRDGRFGPVTRLAGVANPYYGQTPLVADFNGDGYPDLFFVNLDGPARAFFSRGGSNRGLKLRFPDDAGSIGARATVTHADGRTLGGQFVVGTGFLGSSSPVMIFGLGADAKPVRVDVVWPGGRRKRFIKIRPGTTLRLRRP